MTIDDFLYDLEAIAKNLEAYCYEDAPWPNILGAVAVAAITEDPESGAALLERWYAGEEAAMVFTWLEEAASLRRRYEQWR